MRVVLATANPGKQREFAVLLAPYGVQLLLQSSLGIVSAEETGDTFAANALLKARHAAAGSRLPALADDSGLEVDALCGRPGIHSARYAGPVVSDEANNRLLLAELQSVPDHERTARYRCALALVRSADDAEPLLADGVWEGRITGIAAGEEGFGYDPLFVPAGMAITAAQLSAEQKNRLSHRSAALRQLLERLPAWL